MSVNLPSSVDANIVAGATFGAAIRLVGLDVRSVDFKAAA